MRAVHGVALLLLRQLVALEDELVEEPPRRFAETIVPRLPEQVADVRLHRLDRKATLVATEGRYMPNTFKLRAGEEWVCGDGRAEETALSSLGKDREVIAGGSSRNVCMVGCEPQLRAAGLTLSGAPFPAQLVPVAKTPFRTFRRDQ